MEHFKEYWRLRRGGRLRWALCTLLFVLSFALYHLPVAAAAYPAALCLLLLLLLGLCDYLRDLRRHRELNAILRGGEAAMESLPGPESPLERDYQEMVALLRDRLAQERVDAERARRESEEYYTAWVHQIKTAIAAMKLSLQRQEGAEGRRLSGQLRRIEQYVEMVLAYRRLESDSHDYVFRRHSLDGLLRQTLRKLAPDFIDRHITLVYEGVEGELVTDEKWFSFVLEQLLSNALKYTREGGVITLSLTAPGVLTVADTGIGIAPEDLPRIFEQGYTGRNGRWDKSASGLGLYLSARASAALGISLSAQSTPGVGTAVHMTLPEERRIAE